MPVHLRRRAPVDPGLLRWMAAEDPTALAAGRGDSLPATRDDERRGAVVVAGHPSVDQVVADYVLSAKAPTDVHCTL